MNKFSPSLAFTALLALFGASAQASSAYHVYVPLNIRPSIADEGSENPSEGKEPLVLTLQSSVLKEAAKGTAYSFDFSSLLSAEGAGADDLKPEDIAWARAKGDLPAGFTLTGSTLSGTPLDITDGASFEIVASFKDSAAQQVYTIKVGQALLSVKSLVTGYAHTCALTTDGAVYCWGFNNMGQLGDGTFNNRSTPVAVVGLGSGVESLSASPYHVCATTKEGALYCWGRNSTGQLGDGTLNNSSTPVAVGGLSTGVARVTSGFFHTCAVTKDNAGYCWGSNTFGQLGDGRGVNTRFPVPISKLGHSVESIAVGHYHSCAVITGGAVYCWGYNNKGLLGDGTTINKLEPVAVPTLLSGVKTVAAGPDFTCVVTTGGAAYCWGENTGGQLGDGTETGRSSPVLVSGLNADVAAIAPGSGHTCAITRGGAVNCWGRNNNGQLGDGTTDNRLIPKPVVGLSSGVAALSTGNSTTCALTTQGAGYCWGFNLYGQLGDGATRDRPTPVEIPPVP